MIKEKRTVLILFRLAFINSKNGMTANSKCLTIYDLCRRPKRAERKPKSLNS
jgi:hypothetical protein